MTRSTVKSWEHFEKSRQFLGNGSSTSSKIPRFAGIEPAAIVRGQGCRVWDADGNEYIDYRNGLGPVTLGYGVPEINQAIIAQLEKGIVFGHPHQVEGEAAEALVEVIPCAERVKFLKTGGEAVAACIKIARHATGRSKIVQCGYNGWLNTLSRGGYRPAGIAASQPLKGVPAEIGALHQTLPWNDAAAWSELFAREGDAVAAVVIASSYPDMAAGASFLPFVRALTRQHGALLIMDEIVTGFRVALGGVHEYFGFEPDMAVFAKGCANGMPVSVYCGRSALIDSAGEIGISSTYGGEALSLAALLATVAYYRRHDVIAHLWQAGGQLWDGVNGLFRQHGLAAEFKGYPVCPLLVFSGEGGPDADAFLSSCYGEGVSLYPVSYVNYAHKPSDIAETLVRIERALQRLA